MKICPNCNFENFYESNSCERCKYSIYDIKKESFCIDRFIVSNSNTYVVISVLIALSVFLYSPSFLKDVGVSIISNQFSMIIVVPLSFAIYLLLKIINKSWKYSNFNENFVSPDLIQIYLFSFISLLLIFGILLIIVKTNNLGGFCLLSGIVGVLELLAITKNKKIVTEMFVLSSLFTLILGIILLVSLKSIYLATHSDWLVVYLFAYVIFIALLSAGELLGAMIYYLLENYVNSHKDEKSIKNMRDFFTITIDSKTNELFVVWIVIFFTIVFGITLYLSHLIWL